MRQMLTVPAKVIVHLRGGLLEELGDAASDISDACAISDRYPDRLAGPLKRFDRHRALLAAIGRGQTVEALDIDLSVHRWALLASLESVLAAERGLTEVRVHSKDTTPYQAAESNAREIESFLNELKGRRP